MRNFIVWAILIAGVAYGGAKFYLHNEVSETMDMAVLMMAPYADVEYSGVRSTLTGELTVEGMRVRVDGYSDDLYIDRVGIDTPSFLSLVALSDLTSKGPDAMPEYIGFLVEGMRIPVDADYFEDFYEFSLAMREIDATEDASAQCTGKYGFSPATLEALGYEDQVLDMYMTLRDEKTQYSIEMDMSMADMWDADIDIAFAGNMMTEFMQGMAYQPRLRNMHIEFTDRSLNQRVAKYCEELGLDAADTLRAQIESFKFVGESNGIEFDQYILDPYKEFVLGKPTLVVTAQPNNPVAFSQIDLYKPSDVPALLNLSAVAR